VIKLTITEQRVIDELDAYREGMTRTNPERAATDDGILIALLSVSKMFVKTVIQDSPLGQAFRAHLLAEGFAGGDPDEMELLVAWARENGGNAL
jgi:hypothetical protein